jgi:hypothetical protein
MIAKRLVKFIRAKIDEQGRRLVIIVTALTILGLGIFLFGFDEIKLAFVQYKFLIAGLLIGIGFRLLLAAIRPFVRGVYDQEQGLVRIAVARMDAISSAFGVKDSERRRQRLREMDANPTASNNEDAMKAAERFVQAEIEESERSKELLEKMLNDEVETVRRSISRY